MRHAARDTGRPPPRALAGLALAAALLAGCGLAPPPRVDLPRSAAAMSCRPLDGMPGPEDITVDAELGLAYVSSTDRRAVLNGEDPVSPDGQVGHIYRLDLEADPVRAWDVTPTALRNRRFAPHGISLLVLPGGERRLFVINHGAVFDRSARRWRQDEAGSLVEIMPFPATARGAEPLGLDMPVADPLLVSPNDLAAIGPRAFFATNDHGQPPGFGGTLRDLFGLNDGFVVHHDGRGGTRRVLDLPWANGVQADLRARRLYVASSSRGTIGTYAWREDGRLEPVGAPLALGTGADNIELDPVTGDLLVAAHPDAAGLVAHRFGRASAPSQAIRIARGADGAPGRAIEALRQEGDEQRPGEIAAASVAAAYRRRDGRDLLLLGSIFSRFALLCVAEPARTASR